MSLRFIPDDLIDSMRFIPVAEGSISEEDIKKPRGGPIIPDLSYLSINKTRDFIREILKDTQSGYCDKFTNR